MVLADITGSSASSAHGRDGSVWTAFVRAVASALMGLPFVFVVARTVLARRLTAPPPGIFRRLGTRGFLAARALFGRRRVIFLRAAFRFLLGLEQLPALRLVLRCRGARGRVYLAGFDELA